MSDLPSHFKDLVGPLGLDTGAQWGPTLYKELRTAWDDVYARARELKPTEKHLNTFTALLVSSDKKRMDRVDLTSAISQDAIFKILCMMYPRYFPTPKPKKLSRPQKKSEVFRAKSPSTQSQRGLGKKSEIVRIGLGLISTYKPKRNDPAPVVLDEHTTPGTKPDKSIIYTPGWSIYGAFDDSK